MIVPSPPQLTMFQSQTILQLEHEIFELREQLRLKEAELKRTWRAYVLPRL